MVWYILAALLLLLAQSGLTGVLLTRQVGRSDQIGPRDSLPEPAVELARARRALGNLQETLPIFLTIAVLIVVYGIDGWAIHLGGGLYVAGRVAHLGCYMAGLSPWRSLAFGISMIGVFCLAGALIAGIR